MNIRDLCHVLYKRLQAWQDTRIANQRLNTYIKNGRKPWSEGYDLFKARFIQQAMNNEPLIEKFRTNEELPDEYGSFLDERVVELPWFISRVCKTSGRLLDAGSSLNFNYILEHPYLKKKAIMITTLEPENNCFWKDRISYVFGDIRNLVFRDNWFDEVVSISTLEHIGMDISIYTSALAYREHKPLDFLTAVSELKRVTKPGGKVYITVPYGKYSDFGWYQQFNVDMVDQMIETFSPVKFLETYYCYESNGWLVSDKQSCQHFEGFNIHDTKHFNPHSTKDYDHDYAACSRAIAALELWK